MNCEGEIHQNLDNPCLVAKPVHSHIDIMHISITSAASKGAGTSFGSFAELMRGGCNVFDQLKNIVMKKNTMWKSDNHIMINKNLHFSSWAYGWGSWFWWLSSWENHRQLFLRHAGDSGDDLSFVPQMMMLKSYLLRAIQGWRVTSVVWKSESFELVAQLYYNHRCNHRHHRIMIKPSSFLQR